MSTRIGRTLTFAIALLVARTVSAAPYYISPSGSNANSCATAQSTALASAKLTLSGALACVSAGGADTILFHAGTYTGSTNLIQSGSLSIPSGTSWANALTIGAAGDGTVTILSTGANGPVGLTGSTYKYLIIQDLVLDANLSANESVYLADASHIRVQRNTIQNALGFGVHTGDTGGTHYSDDIQVLNNEVKNSGTAALSSSNGHGIYLSSSNSLIEGNNIHDNMGYGVHINCATQPITNCGNITVRFNRVHANGAGHTGCGGPCTTYGITVDVAATNLVYSNLVYDQTTLGAGGILVYSSSTSTGVYNNTIYNVNNECIALQYYGSAPTVRNNICYSTLSGIVDYGGGTGTPVLDHNLTGTNPSFVNAGTGNFALQSGSVARGAGIAVTGVTRDYMGTLIASPYDVGAYQYRTGTLIADGMDLQAALNAAVAGDTLILQAGRRYLGTFTLPVHAATTTITVESAGDLPSVGTRVTPTTAALYAVLVPPVGGGAALATIAGAHDWTLLGLELFNTPDGSGDILDLGDGSNAQTTLAQVPLNLTVDRVYLHGDVFRGQKRGISLNSGNTTIKNCYISDIKLAGQDSQAIAGWNGPGPYLIDNNYLEGAGDNILFGGAATYIALNIPSDITFTHNTVAKPAAWRSQGWQVKNLLELKSAQRVDIENNTFDYVWLDAQVGFAILMTVRNSDYNPGAGINNYWSTVAHVRFANNIVRHVGGWVQVLGHEDVPGVPSGTATDLVFQDNLVFDDAESWGGAARFADLNNGGDNIVFDHNTVIATQAGLYGSQIRLINGMFNNLTITNNIGERDTNSGTFLLTSYDPDASLNGLTGTAALNALAPGWVFNHNVIVANTGTYPPANFAPATLAAVGFTDISANNYVLLSSSAYHNAALDSTDIGYRTGGSSPSLPATDTVWMGPHGPLLPTTCVIGNEFVQDGVGRYFCTATNTWGTHIP